jgi:hypothetical protein
MPDRDADKPGRARTKPAPPDQLIESDEEDAVLSEAARGVVRQEADPRLDAHLARMLSAVDSPVAGRTREADASLREELDRIRAELASAEASAASARRQVVTLGLLLGVAVVAIVILLLLAIR